MTNEKMIINTSGWAQSLACRVWLQNCRRWVTEDLALIYVIKCSAYVFLYKFYSFCSYI